MLRQGYGASVIALAILAGPALAQDAPTATPADAVDTAATAETNGLEDIVVTARRREERLQDAPVAVTAFTARGLKERGVQDVSEIDNFTPNLQFNPTANISGSSAAASIFIRGVGQTDFTLTTEPGVGLYVDGVYIARSVGSVLDLIDIERIEVLRGPQGTLFGKNTIGGAISVTSQAPSTSFGGLIDLTYGRFDRVEAKASVDAPLSDKILTKFSIATFQRDGYAKRTLAGDRLGGRDTWAGRGAVRLLPTDDISFDLNVDYTRARDDSAPTTALAFGNPATVGSPVLPILNSTLPPAQQYNAANYFTGDPYRTLGTGPNFSNLRIIGVSGTLNWDLGGATLKSITAYRDLKSHFGRDADNSPLLFVHTDDIYNQHQFSQELQLSGSSFDDRLKWLVGGFYFKEKGNNINRVILPGAFGGAIGVPGDTFTIHSGGRIDNESLAGFGQATFQFTSRFSITAGLRYSHEKEAFLPDQFVEEARAAGVTIAGPGLLLDPLISSARVSRTDNQFSPRVSVEYKWTPDILTYASFSTGFKGGGFVQRIFPGQYIGTGPTLQVLTAPSFGPEKVRVYEAGLKVTALENRLRFSAAAFHTDYDDIQVTLLQGIAPATQNGGRGNIDGLEAELQAVPVTGLTLTLSGGYTDARYAELDPRVFLNPSNRLRLSNKFPNTPAWNGSAAVSYAVPLSDTAKLTLHGDWSYRSSFYLDAENSPVLRQSGYSLFGASATVDLDDGVSVGVGGRNLSNKRYLTGGNEDLGGLGYAEGTYAAPREWYVTARYRF